MKLGKFIQPHEYGKTTQQCTKELREANSIRRKRVSNGLEVEDDNHRVKNLKEARARNN